MPPDALEIKRLLLDCLHLDDLTPDDVDASRPLAENPLLGMNSVDFLELSVALQNRYGVRVDDTNLAREVLRSIDSIVAFVANAAPA